jgi:uncharacterized protein YxeA
MLLIIVLVIVIVVFLLFKSNSENYTNNPYYIDMQKYYQDFPFITKSEKEIKSEINK